MASFLEDIGFYVVDNMPAPLMPKFAELCMAGPGRYDRVALVTDIRGGQTFDGLFDALHELHRMGCAYKILFVEASVETIIKRYKETRRMHPLSSTSRSLDEAVRQERTVLAPVRQRAEYIIDTSALSTAKLRGEVLRLVGGGGGTPAMTRGRQAVGGGGESPGHECQRHLLRLQVRHPHRGRPGVRRALSAQPLLHRRAAPSDRAGRGGIQLCLWLSADQGLYGPPGEPHRLPPAPVCGGGGSPRGQHRSVAITKALADFIKQKGYQATENHRDMTRA